MAKTDSPLFSMTARGSLAGTLDYQKGKTGTRVRKSARPSNPNTTAQATNRALHALLQDSWSGAPQGFRDAWTLVLGRRRLTAATYFISKNLDALLGQTDLLQFVHLTNSGQLPPPINVVLTSPGSNIGVTADIPPGLVGYSFVRAVGIAVSDQDPTTITIIDITLGQDTTLPIAFAFPQPDPGPPWVVGVSLEATNPAGQNVISAPTVGQVT